MNKLVIPGILLVFFVAAAVWYVWQPVPLKDFELDKEKQEFIWDTEHITFEIENYFGKPLALAVRKRDGESIKKLVVNGFQANVFPLSGAEKKQMGPFLVQTWNSETKTELSDADGLIRFFSDRMEDFNSVERAKTRVLKIEPVAGDEHAWDTKLLITVHGSTKSGMPIKISSHHTVRFRYEDDAEIHEGKAALAWRTGETTLTEATQPLFSESTKEMGLNRFSLPDNWVRKVSDAKQFLFQIAVEDFDVDGDLDVAVATYEGNPFLLCQEDGKFVDRSRELGLGSWQPGGPGKSALAGWIDFDNDGFPDLLMGQSLYRNVGGLRFKNVTLESGYSAGFDPHGVTVADYNNDGLLDFYISRSHQYQQKVDRAGWVGDEEGGTPNTLWKNLGSGKFQDVTAETGSGGGNRTTFASSWIFYDEDHYPDLYVANDFAKNVVLRNRGDGTFEDVSDISGAADFATSMGVATGDLDNDGSTEIYVANMYSKMGRRIISHVSQEDYPADIFPQIQGSCAGNRLYRKQDEGNYKDVTEMAGVNEVGWAFAPLMCDFDGDGMLDIYATTGFMSFNREKPDG